MAEEINREQDQSAHRKSPGKLFFQIYELKASGSAP